MREPNSTDKHVGNRIRTRRLMLNRECLCCATKAIRVRTL